MTWSSDWLTGADERSSDSADWQPREIARELVPTPAVVLDPEQQLQMQLAAAFEDGFRQGQAEGEQRARGAVRSAREALLAAAHTISQNEQDWLNALEQNLIRLAAAIASHIVGRELRAEPQAVADIVRRAVAEIPLDTDIRVRVNPQDLSVLAAPPGANVLPIAPDRELKWVADSSIQAGGCIVESRQHVIDGQVDTALERITQQLLNG